jgi:hypothetical protein
MLIFQYPMLIKIPLKNHKLPFHMHSRTNKLNTADDRVPISMVEMPVTPLVVVGPPVALVRVLVRIDVAALELVDEAAPAIVMEPG